MRAIENDNEKELVVCELSHDDLRILMAGMREICYGVGLGEDFPLRIGASLERAGVLTSELRTILDEQEIIE